MTDKLTPVRCGCGGEAKIGTFISPELSKRMYFVFCKNCGIGIPDKDTEAEAITAWNRAMGERTAKVKGRWQCRKGSDCWECSECHAVLENDDLGMHNFYFCYHCGANMMNKSGYMDIEEVHYE